MPAPAPSGPPSAGGASTPLPADFPIGAPAAPRAPRELADDPDFPRLRQAAEARKTGLFPVARDLLAELVKRRPAWPPARRELILLHLATEEFAEAERLLVAETQRTPRDRWCWMSLGLARHRLGNARGEIECLLKGLEMKFESAAARRLFELQRDGEDFAGALETVALLRRHEDDLPLAVAHAQLLARLGRRNEALIACEQLIERRPAPLAALDQWVALFLADSNDPESVVERMQRHIDAGRDEPGFFHALSRGLHRMERNEEAIAALRRALAAEPGQVQWLYDLAVIQRQMGDIPGSQDSLERALAIEPSNPTALRVYGVEYKHTLGDEQMKRLHLAHAQIDRIRPDRQVELHFALAKAYEDVNELPAAFAHYENAGRLQGRLTPYRHAASEGLLRLTRTNVNRATYDKARELGYDSDRPVFVLGMPRSGTSLAEQIIASHPEAHGAGELKLLHRVLDGVTVNGKTIHTGSEPGAIPTFIPGVDLECKTLSLHARGERYVQALDALAKAAGRDAKRVVDKMPGNYYWTGLIPFILPGARIVHTRRHPVDTCLSIYRIYFPDGMPWSYDQRNLGRVYRAYHDHMRYWETTLPEGFMLSVRYEQVVADLETQARGIIAHIGLPWDEACLKFYETERPVKTASLGQVRQPIYTTSVGRWRKYEPWLKPLLAELGTLPREYEEELHAAQRAAAGVASEADPQAGEAAPDAVQRA